MATDAHSSEAALKPLDDYPAAHSMDSTWWAVDGQGHVARIDTGEAGAMPADAGESQYVGEVLGRLADAAVPFYCDDLFTKPDGKLYFRSYRAKWDEAGQQPVEAIPDQDYASGYLLWLRDDAALAELTPGAPPAKPRPTLGQRFQQLFIPSAQQTPAAVWGFQRLAVPGKVVVWIEGEEEHSPPTPKRIRELLDSGVILRAWGYQTSLEPERFGIFDYQLDTFDNWIAGPFERGPEPPQPVRFDDLPETARDGIELVHLPIVDFRRDVLLQPFEHGPAHCWGEHWISTTGKQFRTEQNGPDLDELQPPHLEAAASVATGGSSLRALAAAYLNGEAGAVDVFNDFLEESGHSRLDMFESPAQRLDEVLLKLLTPSQREALEIAFVEHALEHSPPPPEAAEAARAAIDAVRNSLAGQATKEQLAAAGGAALHSWMPADEDIDEDGAAPRDNGVAWAAWALARRWPLVPARTVRLVGTCELAWQIERVLDELSKTS